MHALAKLAESRAWRWRWWVGHLVSKKCMQFGLGTERIWKDCNILQRITTLQGSRRAEDFTPRNVNQGVSERRVTSASKCLEALDTRLFGVPCSGGGVKSSAGSEERDGHGQTIYIHRRVTDDTIWKAKHQHLRNLKGGHGGTYLGLHDQNLLSLPLQQSSRNFLSLRTRLCNFCLGEAHWPLRLYRCHGKSWRLAGLWTSASPARVGGVGITSNFYSPWMEIHENSIHDNSWDWLLRHRSPRLSKVLRRMIGWLVIIGKVVQLDQQKNWSSFSILFFRRFFPLTMWAQLCLCRIIGPTFGIFVRSPFFFLFTQVSWACKCSAVSCHLRSAFSSYWVGNEVDCNVLPQLPLRFQAVLTKPPLCESTNLKDYRTLCADSTRRKPVKVSWSSVHVMFA